jgi:hypothetical protein
MKQLGEKMGYEHQENVTGRNACHKIIPCFFTMIDAVLDNSKNDRTYGYG